MSVDRTLLTGSTGMLILKLLEEEDLYGYQMIERLRERSQNVFEMKAGTLYPLLHQLEQKGFVRAYEQSAGEARIRRYYQLTDAGARHLSERQAQWREFSAAVNGVLGGAVCERS